MNLKNIVLGLVFLLSVGISHAQSNYFVQVPQYPGLKAYKHILADNGFDFEMDMDNTYMFTKTEKGVTTDVLVVCLPNGIISNVMYEYSEEGVKTPRLYKNISKAVIDLFGKPHINTAKEMGWFFPKCAIIVMKDKDGVSMIWTNENLKK